MAEWMYAHSLPVEDHPQGCTCGGCDGTPDYDDAPEPDGHLCFNCIDPVYMTDLGDGMFRCPVCGDEYDERGFFEDEAPIP